MAKSVIRLKITVSQIVPTNGSCGSLVTAVHKTFVQVEN